MTKRVPVCSIARWHDACEPRLTELTGEKTMSIAKSTRRTLIALALATALPGLALAQAKLKVAGIYTVPFEQQWAGRIHQALKAAEARGEIEYKATENVANADYERVMRE